MRLHKTKHKSQHNSFDIRPVWAPRHTANRSMSYHEWSFLGFNISQLLPEVTNSEITRSGNTRRTEKGHIAKTPFFRQAIVSGWDCIYVEQGCQIGDTPYPSMTAVKDSMFFLLLLMAFLNYFFKIIITYCLYIIKQPIKGM